MNTQTKTSASTSTKTDPTNTNNPQQIAIFGATGSIGTSTLAVLKDHPETYKVYALSGYRQLDELFALCQQFRPQRVAVAEQDVDAFAKRLQSAELAIDVVGGQAGLVDIAKDSEVDTIVASIVGSAGLASTLAGVQAGKRILLANKEALVMAGDLLMDTARQSGAIILPVDSEHNAIFQCLPQAIQMDNQQIHNRSHGIRQLWLTASGGPFLYKSFAEMQSATVEQAVAHPNWSMGQKISIDSATMMNKGLELIEACYLFDLPEDKISVAIHPQSIIHSMAEYVDGSILAQMGTPDMRTPIASCLAYPQRIASGVQRLDLFSMNKLEFIEPDLEKFHCLKLARQAMAETQKNSQSKGSSQKNSSQDSSQSSRKNSGNWANIALNASNEVAVEAFLQGAGNGSEQGWVRLTDIANINANTLDKMAEKVANQAVSSASLEEIMVIDGMARALAVEEVATY